MTTQRLFRQFACLTFAAALPLVGAAPACAVDEQLARQIAEAEANYRPVTPEEVEQAKSELAAAAMQLEQFLRPGSRKGEAWKRYLKWQNVQDALAAERPNVSSLQDTLDRFRSAANGLTLPPFRRAASAIERYVDYANIARAPDQNDFIAKQLEVVTKYLDRNAAQPSARARFEIERRLDFLAGIGRAQALTSALNNQFGRPNVRLEVSENMLSRIVSKPVDDVAPVTDCILGTSIRGTGRTTGYVTLQTVPNMQRAAILLSLNGVTLSETNGYKDPVVIRSSGTTRFNATKRIELEDSNFWNYPTKVSAKTATKTRSVKKQGGGFGSRFIAKIGEKKVAEKKPQSNYIAARHAETRVGDNFEEELLPKLQDARFEYLEQFKKPLAERNAEPKYVSFSSTDHSVNVDVLQAGRGQLGADSSPPAFAGGHDATVRLHESGAANFAAAILAGATLSQKTRESDPKLDVELPKALRKAIDEAREEAETEPAEDDDREFKPWSITFRRQRPLTLEFQDQHVKIRVHATEINVAEDTYRGWDIVVDYAIYVQNGGLMMQRDGDIEVIPSAFDPDDGGKLSGRQVGLRGVLAKELNRQADAGRGFPEEIELPMLDLPGDIAHHGPLMLRDAASSNGWLSLGWMLP